MKWFAAQLRVWVTEVRAREMVWMTAKRMRRDQSFGRVLHWPVEGLLRGLVKRLVRQPGSRPERYLFTGPRGGMARPSIKRLGIWRSAAMVQRYGHLADETLRTAAAHLDKLLNGGK